MKKQTLKLGFLALTCLLAVSSCNKKTTDAPKPDEQELITTVKIQLRDASSGFNQTFVYKVENGFSSGTPGTIRIDSLKLSPSTQYDAVLFVENEKESPVEDITEEIIKENKEHLFLFTSNPSNGNGSVSVSNGKRDDNGAPFNQTFKLTTGAAGMGKFQIVLLHKPNNKNGTTTETAGGETDFDVIFPVVIK